MIKWVKVLRTYTMNFMKLFKLLYLIFILFPVAIILGSCIAFITLVEHIIDQCKINTSG